MVQIKCLSNGSVLYPPIQEEMVIRRNIARGPKGNISPYYHLLLDWGVQYGPSIIYGSILYTELSNCSMYTLCSGPTDRPTVRAVLQFLQCLRKLKHLDQKSCKTTNLTSFGESKRLNTDIFWYNTQTCTSLSNWYAAWSQGIHTGGCWREELLLVGWGVGDPY